jgi:hypothetical protein
MPEWVELVVDIQDRGVREPISITSRNEVVDGETRRQAAINAGLEEIPTVVLGDKEVMSVYREKLLLQKHLTKGQRAYILWPLLAPIVDEMQGRQAQALRAGTGRGGTISDSIGDGAQKGAATLSELAHQWGFSRDTLAQAETLHLIFLGDSNTLMERNLEDSNPAELREEWEPKILSMTDPIGLGAALAGIAGAKATAGAEKKPNAETQLELFSDGASTLGRVAKSFPRLTPQARGQLVQTWRRISAGWPQEMRTALGHALLDGEESATT